MDSPLRIVLVGCGSAKVARRAPACQLYTGPLFREGLAWATVPGRADSVFILSALHGLVEPFQELEPYDHRLGAAEAPAWGQRVGAALLGRIGERQAVVTVLAGCTYVDPLRLALASAGERVLVRAPLEGLQVGERLSWFRGQKAMREGRG